jgi:hypothetical protein
MAGFSSGRIAIAICGRCSFKYPYRELRPDGNSPGLRVCKDCRDNIDPYRLAPRPSDNYILKNPRPDTPLVPEPNIAWDQNALFWDDGLFWDEA